MPGQVGQICPVTMAKVVRVNKNELEVILYDYYEAAINHEVDEYGPISLDGKGFLLQGINNKKGVTDVCTDHGEFYFRAKSGGLVREHKCRGWKTTSAYKKVQQR